MESKLTILDTVIDVHWITLSRWPYLMRIAAPWVAIFILLDLIATYYLSGADSTPMALDLTFLYNWSIIPIYCVGWSSIAVLWHRNLLCGEQRGLMVINEKTWLYFWRFVLICIVMLLALVPITILVGLLFGSSAIIVLPPGGLILDEAADDTKFSLVLFLTLIITAAIFAAVTVVFLRLSLILPAAAVDAWQVDMRASWRATTNYGLRMLMATILISLPYLALNWLFSVIMPGQMAVRAILYTIWIVIDFVYLMFGVTLLSVMYSFLIDSKPIGPVSEPVETSPPSA